MITAGRSDLKVHHVGIVVDDVDEAVLFMRDVLGLGVGPIVDLGPSTGRVVMVEAGDIHLELVEYADPERRAHGLDGAPARIEHVAFDVVDAYATHRRLAEHGVKFAGPVKERADCTTFFSTPESSDGVMYQFRQPVPSPTLAERSSR